MWDLPNGLAAGKRPGKQRILHLNQYGRRDHFGTLISLVSVPNELGNPYLSIRAVGVTFTIASIQGRAHSLHLVNGSEHRSIVERVDWPVSLVVDVWSDAMRHLAGIAAERDSVVESDGSEPDWSILAAIFQGCP